MHGGLLHSSVTFYIFEIFYKKNVKVGRRDALTNKIALWIAGPMRDL